MGGFTCSQQATCKMDSESLYNLTETTEEGKGSESGFELGCLACAPMFFLRWGFAL